MFEQRTIHIHSHRINSFLIWLKIEENMKYQNCRKYLFTTKIEALSIWSLKILTQIHKYFARLKLTVSDLQCT